MQMRAILVSVLVCLAATGQAGSSGEYPHPLERFTFDSQRQSLSMAYMDVKPDAEPRGAVLLLHGKNFNGAYWHQTIEFLVQRGYRVIVPDQVGFGRSSKPARYQFTFDQLAANTRTLLSHLQVKNVIVVGHSMGGMLATQFALQYPQATERLFLLNPIGLEDWRAMGVPYVEINALFRNELKKNFEGIKAYQRRSYCDGDWAPEYERWARMLAGHYDGDQGEAFAWNMALTADMVMSQPVVYQFDQLSMPVTLLIGTRDRTAIGRDLVSDELAERMGDYTQLGKTTAKRIPDATLVEFEDVGHLPQIEAPGRYLQALGEQLAR
jgi:pimeloyl-ACP methyl ester carboxylesterase